jgi:hypothetical protein
MEEHMNCKSTLVAILTAGFLVATSMVTSSPGNAQADPKVAKAMTILKTETAKLGAPDGFTYVHRDQTDR